MRVPSALALTRLSLHEWACLRTELIWIYDRAVPPETQRSKGIDNDRLNQNWVWYLRKGQVRVTTKSSVYEARAGMWLMLPHEKCEQEFSEDAHILSIHFICQWPSGQRILADKKGLVLKGQGYPHLEKNAKRLERLVQLHFPLVDHKHPANNEVADYSGFLEFQTLFFNWLSSWFQVRVAHGSCLTRVSGGDSRPLQAARYLNEAPFQYGSPKKWLYREVGLSEGHLNRIFLHDFGLTPCKYWERRRLEFVKTCLEAHEMPIKEIAYRAGFRSDSHFVSWFRRLTKNSPGGHRRNQRS